MIASIVCLSLYSPIQFSSLWINLFTQSGKMKNPLKSFNCMAKATTIATTKKMEFLLTQRRRVCDLLAQKKQHTQSTDILKEDGEGRYVENVENNSIWKLCKHRHFFRVFSFGYSLSLNPCVYLLAATHRHTSTKLNNFRLILFRKCRNSIRTKRTKNIQIAKLMIARTAHICRFVTKGIPVLNRNAWILLFTSSRALTRTF